MHETVEEGRPPGFTYAHLNVVLKTSLALCARFAITALHANRTPTRPGLDMPKAESQWTE